MSTKRSRLVHTVELRLFEDDSTGEYGLTHTDTCEGGSGDGFNAFYDAKGIFHDVFEHWFERRHKYFQGIYAMNVGGEMAAMGAAMYYYDTLGLSERPLSRNSIYAFSDQIRLTTESMVTEAIGEGYCNFGATLECAVPRQRESCAELECQIEQLARNVRQYRPRDFYSIVDESARQAIEDERARNRQFGEDYRKSATASKIRRLHRWGYHMASKLVPNHYDNRDTLTEFLTFWEAFCKRNPAEELANVLRGITFKVYRDTEERISWKAFAMPSVGTGLRPMEIHKWFSMDDLYAAGGEE